MSDSSVVGFVVEQMIEQAKEMLVNSSTLDYEEVLWDHAMEDELSEEDIANIKRRLRNVTITEGQ